MSAPIAVEDERLAAVAKYSLEMSRELKED